MMNRASLIFCFTNKIVVGVALVAFALTSPLSVWGQEKEQETFTPGQAPPTVVQGLRVLIDQTPQLKADIEKALAIQEEGSSWHGKDVEDFIKFFEDWLVFNITPEGVSTYIEPFDRLANSPADNPAGEILFNNNVFSSWFISFLDARGDYLKTPESTATLNAWMKTDQIDMTQFVMPEGGYKTFWDFFLRKVKPGARPIAAPDNPAVVVSPSDGGTCQIFVNNLDTNFKIKRDELNIRQALNDSPYAEKFVGGPVLDTLLWFTDYHHFHAPVSGKIVELSEYAGSYNYDFAEVSWYADLAKHKRLCYIFETEEHGFVAMIPVGFWGVGSCIPTVKEGDVVKKGQEIGHFGYGGSSILLVFEPGAIEYTENFPINRKNRRDGGFPVKQGQEIGRFIEKK